MRVSMTTFFPRKTKVSCFPGSPMGEVLAPLGVTGQCRVTFLVVTVCAWHLACGVSRILQSPGRPP